MQSLLTSEDTMRVIERHDGMDAGQNALIFALGAAGGLAVGMALSRRPAPSPDVRRLGTELRSRARTVARTLRPERMRRMAVEQDELTRLEDAVLDSFLNDEILSERGVDVGAISHGIVELSGSVWSHAEADRAVRVASGVPGVRTVVNRLEIEGEPRHPEILEPGAEMLLRRTGRTGGMGRRRQARSMEPHGPDESQHMSQRALAAADRMQWSDEGYAHSSSSESERPGTPREPWREEFGEQELDNQDPHGQHAAMTHDSPPEELHSETRVGEGIPAPTELRLEETDLPLKPHGDPLEESRQNE